MAFLKSLAVLLFLFSCHHLHLVNGLKELNNFVTLAMANYTQWLQTENLDPSPPLDYTMYMSDGNEFVQFGGELTNHSVSGHSKEILVTYIETNLDKGYLRVSLYYLPNVTMKGTYKATGTVVGHPLNGSGNWFISSNRIYQSVSFEGFTVTPQGYIDLSTANVSSGISDWRGYNITSHFDGLWDDGAGGYADKVKEALEENYIAGVKYLVNQPHPLIHLMRSYFMAIFEYTPLSEMIGATLPTTPGPSTTTPIPPSTCPPCSCEGPKETILEEFIVGKEVKTDDSGEEHVITKKWILVTVEE